MRLRTLARKKVDEALAPFREFGHMNLGEDITQMQHALQCAWFAEQDDAPEYIILAALLHDVGHLITWQEREVHPEEHLENGYHEKVGAQFLAKYFDDDIVKPVRLHVAAKRYLFSADLSYREKLSAASEESLMLQGGFMDESTCRAFESSPWFQDALLIRKYDELGKQANLVVPDLSHYHERLIQHTRVVKEKQQYA